MTDRPRCHNRVPFTGIWAPNGPGRLRWIEHRMSDRCAAWDSGPSPISDSVPARAGWNCAGCRWLPEEAKRYLRRVEMREFLLACVPNWITRVDQPDPTPESADCTGAAPEGHDVR